MNHLVSPHPRNRVSWLLLLVAILCSLALTVITVTPPMIPGDWARLDNLGIYIPQNLGYKWPSYGIQVGFWFVMIAALLLAGRRFTAEFPTRTLPKPHAGYIPNHNRFIANLAALVGIMLLGFALRLHTLTSLPLVVDEIGFAAHASDILHGQHVPIFAPGHNSNPSVFSWLVAVSMSLFGQNLFAIRLVPLLLGTLSIPAAYLLGREWYSKRVGLLAALFLATFPVHVFYSRFCMYVIGDPLLALLAFAFLARAVRWSHWSDAVLAGIYAGIAQYFYHGSRLIILLMVVYIAVSHLRHKKPVPRPKSTPSQVFTALIQSPYLWMLAACVLVSLPRFGPMFTANLPITGNMQAIRLPKDLLDNTVRSLLAWVGQPDISLFWLSSQRFFLWPALLAFLLGLVLCLWRWRDPRALIILLSLPLTSIFGGAILVAAPLYIRYIVALPAIVLLVALGLEAVLFGAERYKNTLFRFLPPYTGAVLVLTVCFYGCYSSYIQHPQQALTRVPPGLWEEDALARQAAQLPPKMAAAFIVSPDFGAPPPDPRVMQMIGISHYVAAYGERRAVIINQDNGATLPAQERRLAQPSVVLRSPYLP